MTFLYTNCEDIVTIHCQNDDMFIFIIVLLHLQLLKISKLIFIQHVSHILHPYLGIVGFLWHHLFESSIVHILDSLKRVCTSNSSIVLLSCR